LFVALPKIFFEDTKNETPHFVADFQIPSSKKHIFITMPLSYVVYGSTALLVITLLIFFINSRKKKN